MSIHHLETAAEIEIHATSKLVLMALADDASKDTRISFPGIEKLQLWSGAKPRRIYVILDELIASGYLMRLKSGQPGRRAEFRIFPTDAEIEAAEATSDQAAAAPSEPVDNSETVGALECTHGINNGCTNRNNGCTPECTPPVRPKPLKDLTQSSIPAHVTEPVDNYDDDVPSPPTPRTVFGHRRPSTTIDTAALAASVGHVFADTGIDDEELGRLAGEILGRAKFLVQDPTAYVTAAIRRDPFEWQSRAHELVADMAALGGNRF